MNKSEAVLSQPTECVEKAPSPVLRLFHAAGEFVGWISDHLEPPGTYYWRSGLNTWSGDRKNTYYNSSIRNKE